MKTTLRLAVLLLCLVGGQVMALTLSEARTQGRVGETLNGYLVALKGDAQTQTLVANINQAREASYRKLAQSHGIPVDEVAKMAGQKLVERAKPGEYVQGINGQWLQK
ncbi:TPA: YdbL family protein [Citrobacter freundii]